MLHFNLISGLGTIPPREETGEGIFGGARSFPALPERNLPLPNCPNPYLIYQCLQKVTVASLR